MKRISAGFTIVELTVAIAIMASLAGLAVPTYLKHAQRVRQTEAKSALSGIYAVEKTFHIDNNTYTSCLSSIGYSMASGPHYYTTGMDLSLASTTTCGVGTTACNCFAYDNNQSCVTSCNPSQGTVCFPADSRINSTAPIIGLTACANGPLTPAAVLQPQTFQFLAAGSVSNLPTLDVWSMDNNKSLVNSTPGL